MAGEDLKFKYTPFPSSLIERSLSNNPDDISRINIGILVSNEKETATVNEIRLRIPEELTTNFKMVAPTTNQHGRWRATKKGDPSLISVEPLDDTVTLAKDDSFIIRLNDVEVSTTAGLVNIDIQERPGNGETFQLELRKIDPFLRIDFFKRADTGFIEEGGKTKVNLTWATTAAESVKIIHSGSPFFEKEVDGNGTDEFEINDTITVFTLEATGTGSSQGGDKPDTISQQLMVVKPRPEDEWRDLKVNNAPFEPLILEGDEFGPQYFKDSMGIVHFRGRIQVIKDNITDLDFRGLSEEIGTVDEDCKPEMSEIFPVVTMQLTGNLDNTGGVFHAEVVINPEGALSLNTPSLETRSKMRSGDIKGISFSGITYRAARP